jgi:hypothetical protein
MPTAEQPATSATHIMNITMDVTISLRVMRAIVVGNTA